MTIEIYGAEGDDTIKGGAGNDRIYGGAPYVDLGKKDGDDTIDAGSGNDNVYAGNGKDEVDAGKGNDIVHGEKGNDRILGGAGIDVLYGDEGRDYIDGGDDADTIEGGDGNDKLYGGGAHDTLRGGDGNDRLWGGDDFDYLNGDDGNDRIWGEAGNDRISGGAGNDRIKGGADNDIVYGDDGNDKIWGQGGSDSLLGYDGNDKLIGGDGDDNLRGGDGKDVIRGGDGKDQIAGDGDADRLIGGLGDDIFRYYELADSRNGRYDSIVAGDGAEAFEGVGVFGGDTLALSYVDADETQGGNQGFIADGTKGKAHLWLENRTGDTWVFGNVDDDGYAEFRIRIADGDVLASDYVQYRLLRRHLRLDRRMRRAGSSAVARERGGRCRLDRRLAIRARLPGGCVGDTPAVTPKACLRHDGRQARANLSTDKAAKRTRHRRAQRRASAATRAHHAPAPGN